MKRGPLDVDPAVLAERGHAVGGPPWILGHRGAPRLAPENTVASLAQALALGLDGVEFDVQPSREGEPVVLHDESLDRTTNAKGPVDARPLVELCALDAGAWFGKRFAGESLPHLGDALDVGETQRAPIFMVELKTTGLVDAVVEQLRSRGLERTAYLASFHRSVVVAARDAGLRTMLLAEEAHDDDRLFVRRERIDAHGLAAHGWRVPDGALDWPCERWAWSVDLPRDLLEACRRPLSGFNTNEPLRALSVRALVALAPSCATYPLEVPELEVQPEHHGHTWSGDWRVAAFVTNPFDGPVDVELAFAVRTGAFRVASSWTERRLAPRERVAVELTVEGGTHSPGGDPLLVAHYRFDAPVGRVPDGVGELVLDAPLVRRRVAVARSVRTRHTCLTEAPGREPATFALERRGRSLVAALEHAGGLADARLVVRLDGRTVHGASSVRLDLPADFDHRRGGVDFSVAVLGVDTTSGTGGFVWHRWSGGLPSDLLSGEPGRLVPER